MTPANRTYLAQLETHNMESGMPKSIARVLSYLTICEPAQQSADALRETLGLSAGSVSAALQLLQHVELVKRSKKPHDRRYFYELDPAGWKHATLRRLRTLGDAVRLAELGLETAPHNQRLSAMRDMYKVFDDISKDISRQL